MSKRASQLLGGGRGGGRGGGEGCVHVNVYAHVAGWIAEERARTNLNIL